MPGSISGRFLWKVPLGGSSGRFLREVPLGGSSGVPPEEAPLQGSWKVPVGGFCGRLLWDIPLGGSSGRFLWEVPLEGSSERFLWKVPLGGSSGRFLWKVFLWEVTVGGSGSGRFLVLGGYSGRLPGGFLWEVLGGDLVRPCQLLCALCGHVDGREAMSCLKGSQLLCSANHGKKCESQKQSRNQAGQMTVGRIATTSHAELLGL